MQIVIDIPDTEIPIERAMDTITLFFKNGHVYKCNYPFKELPKGHGDLIDVNYLREDFKASKKISFVERMDISCIVDHAPIIIAADKEGD